MLTAAELAWSLNEAGIHAAALIIKDEVYSQLKESWIAGPFSVALDAHVKVAGLEKWTRERNDCDDYADEARLLCRRAHAKGNKLTGVAFGCMRYLDDVKGWHWINFAVVAKRKIAFYEPQTRTIKRLSGLELISANAIYV